MADANAVFEFLRNMIVEIKDLTPDELTPDTSIDELGLDSLDYVEIQVNVKREFAVALTPALFETKLKTIGQLGAHIAAESVTQEV